jgi:hypothetical protein
MLIFQMEWSEFMFINELKILNKTNNGRMCHADLSLTLPHSEARAGDCLKLCEETSGAD